MLHVALYASALYVLIAHFSWTMLAIGLLTGWMLWLFGISISLHRWTVHKAFTPKNDVIEKILLWLGTLCTLESSLSWGLGHRVHHVRADTKSDPFTADSDKLIDKLKIWFYYHNEPIDKFRMSDIPEVKNHMWFHNNYFKVLLGTWTAFILLFGFVNFGYLIAIPCIYVFTGYGWINLIAHSKFFGKLTGYRLYKTKDYSYNSRFWAAIFPGEGMHNTHHASPGRWNTATLPNEFDIASYIVPLVGIPKDRPIRDGINYVSGKEAMSAEYDIVDLHIKEKNK
jgi:stearoyl-CoA desaturase (delta-9 desaturase)